MEAMTPADAKLRDASRTRTAILEAATHLFAQRGYAATGMQEIATMAGVARGTPSYFFGSKAQLWQAVMEHQATLVGNILPGVLAALDPHPSKEALRDAVIDGLLDFHHQHPDALRLIQWAELQGSALLQQLPAYTTTVQSALPMLRQFQPELSAHAAAHLTLTLLGACYAHFSYGRTFGTPLGLDTQHPDFIRERRAHLHQVLLALLP